MRKSEANELLGRPIDEAISRKPRGHDFIIDRRHNKPALSRHMSVTGVRLGPFARRGRNVERYHHLLSLAPKAG